MAKQNTISTQFFYQKYFNPTNPMPAINDIITHLDHTPTMQELIDYLNSLNMTSKAMKYLLYELSEITGEQVTNDHIQQVYPHEP